MHGLARTLRISSALGPAESACLHGWDLDAQFACVRIQGRHERVCIAMLPEVRSKPTIEYAHIANILCATVTCDVDVSVLYLLMGYRDSFIAPEQKLQLTAVIVNVETPGRYPQPVMLLALVDADNTENSRSCAWVGRSIMT